MRNEDQNKKIEYYKDTLNGIDSDLISLIKERLSLSEELAEYVLKNNLDIDDREPKVSCLSGLENSDRELNPIFLEIDNIYKKRERRIKGKYQAKYGIICGDSPLLVYLFREFIENSINNFQVNEDELENLLARNNFRGYFVKNDLKSRVLDKLADATNQAKEIGEVNLIQKHKGRNFGFNTEYLGLIKLLNKYEIKLEGKDVIVIEDDLSNKYIDYALEKLGARSVKHLRVEDFENFQVYYDQVLINTADLDSKKNSFDLKNFDKLELVIDLAAKDFTSRLMIQACDKDIQAVNGLYKEIFEYKKAMEILFRKKFDDAYFEELLENYISDQMNIVLVGMPGAGKTTIARKLGKLMNRKHIDLDREFYYEYGIAPQEYLRKYDEDSFREKEQKVVKRIGKLKGVVISTSGGVVAKKENYAYLKRNAIIFMVERELTNLSTKNRPLSQGGIETLIKMKDDRMENYIYFTDYTVENKGDFHGVAYEIQDIYNRIKLI